MNAISPKRKIISLALKLTVIVCAVTGTLMSAGSARNVFMGGSRALMYFTIQSNILIALICLIGACLLLRKKPPGKAWAVVKLAGTVAITLTGAVFAVMLAPLMGNKAWSLTNTLTHLVVPLAAIADFFAVVSGTRIERKNVIWVLVPPFLYVIYAAVGFVNNWDFARGQNYPYFFLNWGSPAGAFGFSDQLPYLGCVWWILILCLFLLAAARAYLALADRIGRKLKKQ